MARRQAQTEPHPFAADLKAVDLFADLEARRARRPGQRRSRLPLRSGEVVVAEGDQSGRFHLIVSGQASATRWVIRSWPSSARATTSARWP